MTAKIERFEDLVAWQKARELTRAIYLATQQGQFVRDFGLAGQIQRAAVSVVSNVAVGFERGGHAEFYRFLTIAESSCAELRSQLYLALDTEYLELFAFEDLLLQAEEVGHILAGLRSAVGRQRDEERSKETEAKGRKRLGHMP